MWLKPSPRAEPNQWRVCGSAGAARWAPQNTRSHTEPPRRQPVGGCCMMFGDVVTTQVQNLMNLQLKPIESHPMLPHSDFRSGKAMDLGSLQPSWQWSHNAQNMYYGYYVITPHFFIFFQGHQGQSKLEKDSTQRGIPNSCRSAPKKLSRRSGPILPSQAGTSRTNRKTKPTIFSISLHSASYILVTLSQNRWMCLIIDRQVWSRAVYVKCPAWSTEPFPDLHSQNLQDTMLFGGWGTPPHKNRHRTYRAAAAAAHLFWVLSMQPRRSK